MNVLMSTRVLAQIEPPAIDTIYANNVSARFAADGLLDWNEKTGLSAYRVSKDSSTCSIFAGSLWIGGIDAGKVIHTAAATYRQNGNDFWPGPIRNSVYYTAHEDTLWNKLYEVNKTTIDSFKAGLYGSKVPSSILNWPGNGDVLEGEMPQLAPYVDVSHSGYYNPAKGDYPAIRGDQALYMIYNDQRAKHTESGGAQFGVEVHLMVYQFISSDTAVNDATFLHYDIYNRSSNTYDSVYVGNWCNMGIGFPDLNYIGCDTLNNFWYTYFAFPVDTFYTLGGYAYGMYPPAEGMVYLCDIMKHFVYYNNDFSVMGNPTKDSMYYNYLKSDWGDGRHMTYGGDGFMSSDTGADFTFPGNPVTGAGWSEVSAKDPSGDRRGVSSIGPFTFTPGGCKSVDVALVFAQNLHADSIANLQSVSLLEKYVADVRGFYNSQSYGCDNGLLGISELKPSAIECKVYPNPSDGVFTIEEQGVRDKEQVIQVFNVLGQQVYSQSLSIQHSKFNIDLSNNPSGLYIYRIISHDGMSMASGKIVIQQ